MKTLGTFSAIGALLVMVLMVATGIALKRSQERTQCMHATMDLAKCPQPNSFDLLMRRLLG